MTAATIHLITDQKARAGLLPSERHHATRFVLLVRRAPIIASAFLGAIDRCLDSQWLAAGGPVSEEDQREVLHELECNANPLAGQRTSPTTLAIVKDLQAIDRRWPSVMPILQHVVRGMRDELERRG